MAVGRPGVVAVRPGYLVAGLAALAGLAAGWFTLGPTAARQPGWLAWALPPLCCVLATIGCRQAATAQADPGPARQFWRALTLAAGLACAASVTLVGNRLLGDTPGPRLDPASLALYLTSALVGLGAVARLPVGAADTRLDRLRLALDTTVVVLATGLFTWHFLLRSLDAWAAPAGSGGTAVIIVLAAGAGALATAKGGFTADGPVDRRALGLIGAAGLLGPAGAALAPFLADAPDRSLWQVILPASMVMVALAAGRQVHAARGPTATRRRRRPARTPRPRAATTRHPRALRLMPYVAIAATSGLLIATRDGSREALIVAVGAVVLTGLVVLRQWIAFTDNARLLTRVDSSFRELRELQDELVFQARHDELTGLANRRQFEERTRRALQAGESVVVVLINLDNFKNINERLGHLVGDGLLGEVAGRLRACVRHYDTVARLGGDEFGVLLRAVSPEDITRVLDRISAELRQPVIIGGHGLLVGSSIGLASDTSGVDAAELLRRADLAMHAAKNRGKGRYEQYDAALDQQADNDAEVGADLRFALDHGEFHMVYQPVVRLPDGYLMGVEALVRWHHPVRGTVRPDLFISAAERTGLIVPLGSWVLRETCGQAASWLGATGADRPWTVGVNVSARQLREPGVAEEVAAVLGETGLPAGRLVVEVTETALFENEPAVAALAAISALGVRVALDDFGTGHSSLGLLRSCPVDVLKVDKSFVDGVDGGSEQSVIAAAMIQIAEGLHLSAVAEGVETQEQADRLHELGYRLAQGYLFAAPLPPVAIASLLASPADRTPMPAR